MPDTAVVRLIPFVHVTDVARSVSFYEQLGFAVQGTYHPGEVLEWASLKSADAEIMLARAHHPLHSERQGVLFYVYTPDLDGLRDHLLANGVVAGAIVDGTPGPEREMGLSDPDGYCVMVAAAGAHS